MLLQLANARLDTATKSWLVENPKPADEGEQRAVWARARSSFQKRFEAYKYSILQDWSSAAKLWMQKALHEETCGAW